VEVVSLLSDGRILKEKLGGRRQKLGADFYFWREALLCSSDVSKKAASLFQRCGWKD
jgi:hypothetical protein